MDEQNVKETVEEVIEDVEEKVRPEVYDDFSEDFQQAEEKATEVKPIKEGKIIAISSVIATIASIVIILLGSFGIKLVGGIITTSQLEGTWAFDLGAAYGGTEEMKVYLFMDGGELQLASSEGMEYFTCKYKGVEKGIIEIVATDEQKTAMTGLLTPGEMKVSYDKDMDMIILDPGIGGITDWTAVSKEESAAMQEKIENYSPAPMEGIVPQEVPSEGEVPAEN
ncbi:MAG: hypothetical protein IJC89_05760 [Clostridia bacterium]|nr:hypothetical protein [Clostridia bacterium]